MSITKMKTNSAFIVQIFIWMLLVFVISSPAFAAKMPEGKRPPLKVENPKDEYLAGQVIVKFKNEYNPDSMSKPSSFKLQGWQNGAFGFIRFFIEGDVLKACEELMRNPIIESAEPNYIRYLQTTPNDPLFYRQDNLKLSRAELGWNIETGDANVVVAVIDTGVDINHPDLAYNLIPGANFIDTGGSEMDDSGHGTAVSGVIGALGNNGVGVSGAAWKISILPLRACGGPSLTCSIFDEADAVEEAIAQGADIINLSLGGFHPSIIEETAINHAWSAGIIIFAAVGNDGYLGKFGDPETESNIKYPAGYEHVCGVGSVDYPPNGYISQIKRSDFSNYGDAVSVTAVGSSVITTAPSVPVEYLIFNEQADYGRIDGTSFSTPLVSGLAALVKSHFPNLNNAELRTIIETCVQDIGPPGRDDEFGWGLVDFQKVMIGSNHASNEAFNLGITASPILSDDIIIVVKVKLPINGNPQLVFSYLYNGNLRTGSIQMLKLPNQNNIWATRFHAGFTGPITFKVNGIAQSGGNLPEIVMDYLKEK